MTVRTARRTGGRYGVRPSRAVASLGIIALLAGCGTTVPLASTRGQTSAAQVGSSLDGSNASGGGPGSTAAGSGTTSGGAGTATASVASGGAGGVPGGSGGAAGGAGSGAGGQVASTASGGSGPSALSTPSKSSGPIKVGVMLTNVSGASQYGINTGQNYSEQQVDQALFNALNGQGGVDGHQLVPVYAWTNPSGTDWTTDYQAACATFTQDNHVAAVLGYEFDYMQNFETCLSQQQVPHLVTGYNIPDAQELSSHPLFRSLAVPTIDVRSLEKLQGAIADGVLTPQSKLGVIIDDCPGTVNSWNAVAKPFLAAHHIDVAFFSQGGCSTGNNAGSVASQVNDGILKARAAGVNEVTFLSVSEGPVLLIVAEAAESQNWHPIYITSSLANLSTLEGQAPSDQMANVKSYGWMPSQDVGPSLQPPRTAGQARCFQLLATQKIYPTQFGDITNAYRICDAVFVYEAALKADGGKTGGSQVIGAVDALGNSISIPDVLLGGSVFGTNRKNDPPEYYRAVIWNGSCSCFNYNGPTRQMPLP